MNKSDLAFVCGLLLTVSLVAATSAPAQVTAVITGGSSTVNLQGVISSQTNHNIASQVGDSESNLAGNYQVVSDLTPNNIIFANNGSAEGSISSVTSSTSLAITYTNSGPIAVVPRLESSITPGGFGFYTALNQDPNGTAIGNINNSPSSAATFDNFGTTQPFLAGASFSVTIASDGLTIESYSGMLTVTPTVTDGMNSHGPLVTLTLGGDAASLNNFRLLTPSDSLSEVGYQWDATDTTLTIPGGPLAPGDSRTLTYDTQVTAFTDGSGSGCGGVYQCSQLFAYSGFGDPIGKGSGGTPPSASRNDLGTDGLLDSGSIQDVYFPRFELGLPTFDLATGDLSVPLSSTELPSLSLTVPEPATWALMLAGVGGVGLAVRRRARRQPA